MGDNGLSMELSLPLVIGQSNTSYSQNAKSTKRAALKMMAGISGLVIFGYVMSSVYFSTPESGVISLTSNSGPRMQDLLQKYQIELISSPTKVANFGNANPLTQALTISKNNNLIGYINTQNKIEVWDIKKNVLLAKLDIPEVVSLAFTPDGNHILCIASSDKSVRIWSLETKSEVGYIDDNDINTFLISSDGKFVVTQNYYGVKIWDIMTREQVFSFDYSSSILIDLAISDDNKYIATGNYDGIIEIYNFRTKKSVTSIDTKLDLQHFKFSHDGKYILSTSYNKKSLRVWNIRSKQEVAEIQHRESIHEFDISNDSRYVITSSFDSTAIVYDLQAKKQYTKFRYYVNSFAFTEDSKHLLISNGNNIVKIFSLENKAEIAQLKHLKNINSMVISRDGEYLAVSTYWSVYLWSLENLKN